MSLTPSLSYRLQFQHHTVTDLTKGFDEQQLKQIPLPGKWSALENIAHLVSYQPVFQARIERILNERDPSFERYVADNDPAFLACAEESVNELIKNLDSVRIQIWQRIHQLKDDQLARKGIHPKFGELDITQWTEFFLLHEAHHLFTIFQLLRARR